MWVVKEEENFVHVYPDRPDEDDIYHLEAGPRVRIPHRDCALCRAGLCVQRISERSGKVVTHAREQDA